MARGALGALAGFVEPAAVPPALALTATFSAGSIALAWPAVDGAIWYEVLCGTAPETMTAVGRTLAAAFTVGNLRNGKEYFVQVQAVLSARSGIASAVLRGIAATPAPMVVATTWESRIGAGSPTVYGPPATVVTLPHLMQDNEAAIFI